MADQLKRSLAAGPNNSGIPSGGTQTSRLTDESAADTDEMPDANIEIEASTERVVAVAIGRFKREQIPLYSLNSTVVTFRHSPLDLGVYDVDLMLKKTTRRVRIEARAYRVMTTRTGAMLRIEALDAKDPYGVGSLSSASSRRH